MNSSNKIFKKHTEVGQHIRKHSSTYEGGYDVLRLQTNNYFHN